MKVRKYLTLLLIAAMVLSLLTGCGGSSESVAEAPMAMDMAVSEEIVKMESMSNGALTESGSDGSTALPENRKWIITVDMSAETEDLDTMLAALDERITALNGYVENQNIYNGSSYSSRRYRSASLTIRVPAENVDQFAEDVGGISNVVRTNRSQEDITLQYVDTESRITALKTEEARLLEFMEQAETMADLLEIEARLTDVRYELESYSSRLRTYDNQVNYATIYLNIEEVQEYTPVKEQTTWERISEGFMSSLKGLWKGIVEVFVWVLVNIPYLVVYSAIAAVIVLVVKATRKRKAAKKAAKATKAEPENKPE